MRLLNLVILGIVLGMVGSTAASAIEYQQIAGRWCAPGVGTIEFLPKEIVMNLEKTGERRVLTVDQYRPVAGTLTVHYLVPGRASFTTLGDLRAGGTQVSLLMSDDIPMRNLERCVATIRPKPNPNP